MSRDDTFRRVYQLVARIPSGRVASYGDLARRLGMPNGARTVGWAMRYCSADFPWHRVVNSQGKLMTGERTPEGKLLQQVLLEEEGVTFARPGYVDMEHYEWVGA
jgi:methylated-DNA-protein-cysteine methyltransferase related protein